MKKINNSRLMFSFSIVLIDHRGKNCLKEALNFCKELYSYISASSWNEKILQHSDESDNVGDNIKINISRLDNNQRNNLTFIANHERKSVRKRNKNKATFMQSSDK